MHLQPFQVPLEELLDDLAGLKLTEAEEAAALADASNADAVSGAPSEASGPADMDE